MASVVVNGSVEEYGEAEPKKPVKRGFAKIDVVDVILSGDDGDGPAKTSSTAFEQLAGTTICKGLVYAPTYRIDPKKKFDTDVILKILKDQLEKELREATYNEKECQNACKRISYYIRRAVKQLSYDRYRIICQVRIIEKQNQGLETRAGFLWDGNFDGWVSYSMETQSFAAQAIVFGIYKD